LALRVAAFTAPNLPDVEKSRSVLTNLLTRLAKPFAADAEPKLNRAPGVRYAQGDKVRHKESGEIANVRKDVRVTDTRMDIEYEDGEVMQVSVDACEPID
jgi:hypothetical protein